MDKWKNDANCKNMDTSMFFPGLGGMIPKFVKEVCSDCVVIEECLWYANETHSIHGVFGGMSPNQREDWRKTNRVSLGESRAA
jgi:WhiB family redox-sensing transcriptional regulator